MPAKLLPPIAEGTLETALSATTADEQPLAVASEIGDTQLCSRCEEPVAEGSEYTTAYDTIVCEPCRSDDYTRCDNCDRLFTDLDTAYIESRDVYYCSDGPGSCFNRRCTACTSCDESFVTDDMYRDDSHDYYCEGCYNNGEGDFPRDDDDDCGDCGDDDCSSCYPDSDGNVIYPYHANVLRIRQQIVPPTDLLFGFELELNTRNGARYEAAQIFLDRCNYRGIVKNDGSIGNGHDGIECVSIPLSLRDCCDMLRDVLTNDCLHADAFPDDSCGMHVHFSRAPLTNSQVAKLFSFFHHPDNRAFVTALAGRDLTTGYGRLCLQPSWKQVYAPHVPMKWFHYERYMALNFTNPATIECRMFSATTLAWRAQANVETVAALLAYCRPLVASVRQYHSLPTFLAFVQTHTDTYPNLARLCDELGYSARYALIA